MNTGCTPIKAIRERFVDRDRQGGVWVYEIIFNTRTMVVENYQPPSYPLFTKGTAQEEGGGTAIQVGLQLLMFTGTPGVITLAQGNISEVTVQSPDLTISYSGETDYCVDTVNGLISRIAGGAIAANATVAVGYSYSDVVTALASGGQVPFAPSN